MKKICSVCGRPVFIRHIAQKYHPLCAYKIRLEKERSRRKELKDDVEAYGATSYFESLK